MGIELGRFSRKVGFCGRGYVWDTAGEAAVGSSGCCASTATGAGCIWAIDGGSLTTGLAVSMGIGGLDIVEAIGEMMLSRGIS